MTGDQLEALERPEFVTQCLMGGNKVPVNNAQVSDGELFSGFVK